MLAPGLFALAACHGVPAPDREAARPSPPTGTSTQAFETRDGTRRVVLHLPPTQPSRSGVARLSPLLLLLHGSNADGQEIRAQSGMDAVADRSGVVVAYPEGVRGIFGRASADWNAGGCCGYAQRHEVDDVGFLRQVIDDLSARLPIDPTRIYVAGFSDGGRMAYRAACEMPDRLAAIAVVSGSLVAEDCRPSRVVPLVAVHGTADDDVSYEEPLPHAFAPAAPEGAGRLPPSVRYWARLAGCAGYREGRRRADVRRGEFQRCPGTAIVMWSIEGGTHRWPTPLDDADGSGGAAETVLRFLLRQRAPAATHREPFTR